MSPKMESISKETKAKIDLLKSKLKNLSEDIKDIVEQGRLVESDPSQLFLFKGMFRKLESYFDSFTITWDNINQLYVESECTGVFPTQRESTFQQNIKRYYYESCAIYEQYMHPTPSVPNPTDSSSRTGLLMTLRSCGRDCPKSVCLTSMVNKMNGLSFETLISL